MTQALTTVAFHAFRAAAEQLIDAKRSENTRKAYRRDLAAWLEFCGGYGVDPIAPALGQAALWRDQMLARRLSNETVRRHLASLASLYRVALAQGVVRSNPFHPAVLGYPPANTLGKTKLVTDDVAHAMIAHAEIKGHTRDVAILRLFYDTGLRRESIATIKRSDYTPPRLRVVVKGGIEKELMLPEATCAMIDRWIIEHPLGAYLFPSRDGTSHISLRMINTIVSTHGAAVGAPDVHPHCFRAALATAGYDAGLPEYEIQAALGHKDPKTTRRYDRGARGLDATVKIANFRTKRGV